MKRIRPLPITAEANAEVLPAQSHIAHRQTPNAPKPKKYGHPDLHAAAPQPEPITRVAPEGAAAAIEKMAAGFLDNLLEKAGHEPFIDV